MENPRGREIMESIMADHVPDSESKDGEETQGAVSKEMMEAMMRYMPLRGILSFGGGTGIGMEELQKLLDKLNESL